MGSTPTLFRQSPSARYDTSVAEASIGLIRLLARRSVAAFSARERLSNIYIEYVIAAKTETKKARNFSVAVNNRASRFEILQRS